MLDNTNTQFNTPSAIEEAVAESFVQKPLINALRGKPFHDFFEELEIWIKEGEVSHTITPIKDAEVPLTFNVMSKNERVGQLWLPNATAEVEVVLTDEIKTVTKISTEDLQKYLTHLTQKCYTVFLVLKDISNDYKSIKLFLFVNNTKKADVCASTYFLHTTEPLPMGDVSKISDAAKTQAVFQSVCSFNQKFTAVQVFDALLDSKADHSALELIAVAPLDVLTREKLAEHICALAKRVNEFSDQSLPLNVKTM